jgi:hypothetical protein
LATGGYSHAKHCARKQKKNPLTPWWFWRCGSFG